MGAATETELEDRKLRIEDAKNATFAAVEEGIVPGGGAALLHLSEFVPEFRDTLTNTEEKLGADIVFKSLTVSRAGSLPVHQRLLVWMWATSLALGPVFSQSSPACCF